MALRVALAWPLCAPNPSLVRAGRAQKTCAHSPRAPVGQATSPLSAVDRSEPAATSSARGASYLTDGSLHQRRRAACSQQHAGAAGCTGRRTASGSASGRSDGARWECCARVMQSSWQTHLSGALATDAAPRLNRQALSSTSRLSAGVAGASTTANHRLGPPPSAWRSGFAPSGARRSSTLPLAQHSQTAVSPHDRAIRIPRSLPSWLSGRQVHRPPAPATPGGVYRQAS
jgi:hypothetical protein